MTVVALKKILTIALSLLCIIALPGCELGTFESLDKEATVITNFIGVSGIRRSQTGGYVVFWKNPEKIKTPRILIYYKKLAMGIDELPGSTEIADLTSSLELPVKLYATQPESSPETLGTLITEIANGTESAPIEFPLDPTKHHAFHLKFINEDGIADDNNSVLVLSPTTEEFPGCVQAAGVNESTIKIDYEIPRDAIEMTIQRNGIAFTVVEAGGLPTGSVLDKDLVADTEYSYTCKARFTDKDIVGTKTVKAKTINPLAGIDFDGCKEAVGISGSIVRVTFDFPKDVDKVSVFESGVKRYSSSSPGDTQFDHTGLQEGITYFYQCQAEDQGKTIVGTNEVSARTLVNNPPDFLGIQSLDYKVIEGSTINATVAWAPATGVPSVRYDVYMNPGNQVDWSLKPTQVETTEQSFTFEKFGDDLNYSFGVRACSSDEICDTNTASITKITPDLGAPKTVGATAIKTNDGKIEITAPWDILQGGVAKRKVYVIDDGNPKSTNISDYNLAKTVLFEDPINPPQTIVISGVTEYTQYHFVVRDVDINGNESNNMKVVSIFTDDLTPPFFAGTGSLARKPGEEDRTLIVTFIGVDNETAQPKTGALKYLIKMSSGVSLPSPPNGTPDAPTSKPCVDGKLIKTIENNSDVQTGVEKHIELTGLKPRTQYNVCVLAEDSYGNISDNLEGKFTHTTDLTPPQDFDGIQDIKYDGDSGELVLEWNPSEESDIFRYNIKLWKNNEPSSSAQVIDKLHADFPNGVSISKSEFLFLSEDTIYASIDACDNAGSISGGLENCFTSLVVKQIILPDIAAPVGFLGIKSAGDQLKPSQGTIQINWSNPTDETWESEGFRGFTVYTVENGVLQSLKDCPCVFVDCADKRTSCTVSGLDAYRDYTFHVRAYDAAGNVTQLPYVTVVEGADTPDDSSDDKVILAQTATVRTSDTTAPIFNSNLSTDLNGSQVELSWNMAIDNQYHPDAKVKYQIWRYTQDKDYYDDPAAPLLQSATQAVEVFWERIATVTTATQYFDTTIGDNKRYHYSVCAIDASWSDANGLTNVSAPNRKCDGAIKYETSDDVQKPIIRDFTTVQVEDDPQWTITWEMEDKDNSDVVHAQIHKSYSSEQKTLTLTDIANGDYEQTWSKNIDKTFPVHGITSVDDDGEPNTAQWVNYLLIVSDDAQNKTTSAFSVYSDSRVTITNVSRASGHILGGNLIIIEGSGFKDGETDVWIGENECLDESVFIEGKSPLPSSASTATGSMMTCITPAGDTSGAVDVKVIKGTSDATLDDGYSYCNGDCTNICDINRDSYGSPFQGGTGSSGSPFQICTRLQWEQINSQGAGYYKILDNINLQGSTSVINSLEETSLSVSISGLRDDGGAFVVANYTHPGAGGDSSGLINTSSNSYYRNLGLVNIVVNKSSTTNVGCLVGDSTSNTYEKVYIAGCNLAGKQAGCLAALSISDKISEIETYCDIDTFGSAGGIFATATTVREPRDLSFAGSIKSTNSTVGGIVAGYSGDSLRNLNVNAISLIGKNGVGGLIGSTSGNTPSIINATFKGDISGGEYTGGIVGKLGISTTDAKFVNLVSSGDIRGAKYTGGLFGRINGPGSGTVAISNSHFTGNVSSPLYDGVGDFTGYASSVGGIIGEVNDTEITILNTHSKGTVTGNDKVGGFLGGLSLINESSQIGYCSARSNVTATGTFAGGFVGLDLGPGSPDDFLDYFQVYASGSVTSTGTHSGGFAGYFSQEIENAYARGNVTGGTGVGGFASHILNNANIKNAYATGILTATLTDGGFASTITGSPTFLNNYWDRDTTTEFNSEGAIPGETDGKTTLEMKTQSTFNNWNFDDIWLMPAASYPRLQTNSADMITTLIKSDCSETAGEKIIEVFMMNSSLTEDLIIDTVTSNSGLGEEVINNTCSGSTLTAPFGSCSFEISYGATPTDTSSGSATITMEDGSPFDDITLLSTTLDNKCGI